MTDSPNLFLNIRARHGHYCPMSTLGGRLGMAALAALGGGGSEGLMATYHIDTCAADGIAVATGCSPEVKAEGLHQLVLRVSDGRGVVAELTATALARAAACRRRLDDGADPDETLAELRIAPVEELIALTPLAAGGSADA